MGFNEHIKYVIESFYHITHIPISAYENNGDIIYGYGESKVKSKECNLRSIYLEIKQKLAQNKKPNIVNVTCPTKNIIYTGHPICPRNIDKGIFILGPYSTNRNNKEFLYKPKSLIPQIVYLLRSLYKDFSYLNTHNKDNIYSYHIRKAMEYINLNYKSDITLEDISQYLGITKPYFCSLFKKETKKTFTQALNEFRISKSKELLIETDNSLIDIALDIGFNNQNYFNIVFKRFEGMTPLDYRNQKKRLIV